ncbi:MAG TPA: hypothetical protein VHG88_07695 [Burkholderiales bacterium]|nr:hypothetical protein [Burkholderiales bacterium]
METVPLPFLDRQARAALPLRRQLLLYLDPFALFMDASRGSAGARRRALAYNRAMRWMLVAYMRRWIAITAALFASIAPAEALASQASVVPVAALAVGFCIAFTVSCCIAAAYFFLGAPGSQ